MSEELVVHWLNTYNIIPKLMSLTYRIEQWTGIYLWGSLVGSLRERPGDLAFILQPLK
jgi:hypothetical protein